MTKFGFRPLAGCGLFPSSKTWHYRVNRFRPLAGCGLFPTGKLAYPMGNVSVPLRGVGCFYYPYYPLL